jgi:hypothetical protein
MLRTVKDLQGYAIRATDGVIGEVADFFFDDEDWVIRYLVVDAGTWLRGRHVLISPAAIGHPDWMAQLLPVSITKDQVHHVLVAPQWIQSVSWADASVSVDLTRQAVKDALPYDSAAQLDRQQEMGIYEHYGRPGYWTTQAIRESAADRR